VQLNSAKVKQILSKVSDSLPEAERQIFNQQCYYRFKHVINLIIKYARGGSILDVGCGNGTMGLALKMLGFNVYLVNDEVGYQIGSKSCSYKLLKDNNIPVYCLDASIERFPFDDESFDIVTLLGVIEHFHGTPRFCLTEIYRVLTPDGKLLIDTPNSVNLRKRLSVPFGRSNYVNIRNFYYSDYPYRSHVREYNMSELEAICRWSGFKTVEKIYTNDFYQYHTAIEQGRQIYQPYFRLQSARQLPIAGFHIISRVFKNYRDTLRIVAEKRAQPNNSCDYGKPIN